MGRNQNRGPDWIDGFPFLANHLALDFLNTRLLQNGELVELLPDFHALLRWFQAAGRLRPREVAALQRRWGGSARARRTLHAMRRLRETLRKQVIAWERGRRVRPATVQELNRLLALYPMRTRLKVSGSGSSTGIYFAARQPEDLFAPIAHAAAMLFAHVDRNRVRKCDQCVLHFRDISKKGTRRWCSMQMCGNRHKVAAYATRRRVARQRLPRPRKANRS